ncbi:MAG: ATP-binding protein, partial [Verrucomicrobiota bacterium]
AYIAADLATGSQLHVALWLTAGNLVCAGVGYFLFRRLSEEDRQLRRPLSVLYLFSVCAVAAFFAALVGGSVAPVLFGNTLWEGFGFWFSTEIVNAVVVLPVILTAPSVTTMVAAVRHFKMPATWAWGRLAPLLMLIGSVIAGILVGGPGAIAFPVPALLWCSLTYGLFASSLLTMLLCIWMMIATSAGLFNTPQAQDVVHSVISVRLGIMLLALGPLTVASVNQARNRMLEDERRLSEELKRARDAAEAAQRVKSQFLAVVSHEIRTPMNGIIGMTNLLAQTPLTPSQQEMGRLIQGSAESLLTIINDILDFSKIEAGKLHISPVAFELPPIIDETIAMLTSAASDRHLTLVRDVDPELSSSALWGDDGRIRQVLLNLVGNAIKFTEQGSVTVIASKLPGSDAAQTAVRIAVRDTGIGIPHEAQVKLFQPFIQADNSVTRRFGGTGLGLSICRQLVKLMGGEIGVNSHPGRGSEFWFTLTLENRPLEEITAGATVLGAPPAAVEKRSLRVLVADDNSVNQAVARGLLTLMGHDVAVVGNGHEALTRLARTPHDVVLMDCQMPGLDGYEATRRIRAGAIAGIDPRIRIIAVTASAMAGDREACLEAGMDDFVTKPIRVDEVRAALERASKALAAIPPGGLVDAPDELINSEALANLRGIPGFSKPSLLFEVLELFLQTTPNELEHLTRLIAAQDGRGAITCAHSLAGGCGSAGARQMQTTLRDIEKIVAAGAWDAAGHALLRLNEEWLKTRAALLAELSPVSS